MSDPIKVVYKLLITHKIEPEKILSDDSFQIKLNLKNIGGIPFPGGEIALVQVRYSGLDGSTQTYDSSKLPKIQALDMNQSLELEPLSFLALTDGLAWITIRFKPPTDGEIHLFQSLTYDMGNNWGNLLKVRNRDYETIISLLQKITELLERREKDGRKEE